MAAARVLVSSERSHQKGTRLSRPGVNIRRIVACEQSAMEPKNDGVRWQAPGGPYATRSVMIAVSGTVATGTKTIHRNGRYQRGDGAERLSSLVGSWGATLVRLSTHPLTGEDGEWVMRCARVLSGLCGTRIARN
jgi:hypothetical protein